MITSQELLEQRIHRDQLHDDPEYREAHIRKTATQRLLPTGDCYPYKMENVAEALQNMNDITYETAASMFREGSAMEAGYHLNIAIMEYWTKVATILTEREIDNAKV